MTLEDRILFLVILAFSVTAAMARFISKQDNMSTIAVIACIVTFLTGLLFLDIYRMKPSSSHTMKTVCQQYIFLKILGAVSGYSCRKFERLAGNIEKQQLDILLRLLRNNKTTKFSKDHGLVNVSSVEEYKQRIPLTRYDYYRNYIKLIEEEAAADVLFPGKSDYLALTSGTSSGKSKVIPKKMALMKSKAIDYMMMHNLILNAARPYLRRIPSLRVYPRFSYTKHGVKRGPMSGLSADTSFQFLEPTPERGGCITSEKEALYIRALFILLEEEILYINAHFSSTLLTFFKLIERNWRQLCMDIQTGHVSKELDISEDLRLTFNKYLTGGNLERANWLRKHFQDGFKDMLPRIWPTCQAVIAVATGTFKIQADIVKESYLGGVPLLSAGHFGTETVYGFSFCDKADLSEYFITAQFNFFEFIKYEDIHEDQPHTYLCHQLEPGQKYEVVVTTQEGLHRYRTEDVIEVTGFYKTVPKYYFIQRASDILSVHSEKVPEFLLREALLAGSRDWPSHIAAYTTTQSFHADKLRGKVTGDLYYLVFVELENKAVLSIHDREQVDVELMARHDVYAAFRRKGTLGPVRVCQVSKGTFEDVKEKLIEDNPEATSVQYKIPAIVKRDDVLRILLRKEVLNQD